MARELVIRIVGDADSLERELKKSSRDLKRFEGQASGLGGSFKKAFAGAAAAVGVGIGLSTIVDELKGAVSASSDLAEQMSKTTLVFGRSADEVKDWATTTATSIGTSQREALRAASTFGLLFKNVGQNDEASSDLSRTLVELGADLASLNNTSPTDALAAIRSGLTGEIEPLRKYGVFLSEAATQQQALADTGKKNARELTTGEKVLARYELLMKGTTVAQGDFGRTSEELANQQRILTAQVDDLQASLGEALLPHITDVVAKFNEWLADPANKKRIIDDFTQSVNALADAFEAGARTGSAFAEAWGKFTKVFRGLPGAPSSRPLVPSAEDLYTTGPAGFAGRAGSGRPFVGMPGGPAAKDPVKTLLDQVRSWAAVNDANRGISQVEQFINKYLAMGKKFGDAQKAAEAARARRQLQRQRFAAGLENQWAWLQFGEEKAGATKTLRDDRRILRKQEAWLKNRISHAGRTLALVSELWRVQQKIRDLNKKNADVDPLAGLMQVSSKRMASMLAAGTGLSAAGQRTLGANIAGLEMRPVYVAVNIDGREVGRVVAKDQARTSRRTARQTSGYRG